MTARLDVAFGRAAIGGVLVIASVPLLIALGPVSSLEPPETIPRWLVLGILIALPAVVGWIGLRRADAALLVAAGFACLPLMFMSIATFPLLIPAVLFIASATQARQRPRPATALAGVLIVGLVVASLTALLTTTETRCWLAFETAGGGYVYRDATADEAEGPIGGPGGGPIAAGCAGGALTLDGIALAALLGVGSVALALAAPLPRGVDG